MFVCCATADLWGSANQRVPVVRGPVLDRTAPANLCGRPGIRSGTGSLSTLPVDFKCTTLRASFYLLECQPHSGGGTCKVTCWQYQCTYNILATQSSVHVNHELDDMSVMLSTAARLHPENGEVNNAQVHT